MHRVSVLLRQLRADRQQTEHRSTLNTCPTASDPDVRVKVAVIVGATSKWQRSGSDTLRVHGSSVDDRSIPVSTRWGIGGAIAQKFASEGFLVVLTTRRAENAKDLQNAIVTQRGHCLIVELELTNEQSIKRGFAEVRSKVGDPHIVIYNAGYAAGRELPEEKELLEYVPTDMFDLANHLAMRAPFIVAKEVLPAMRAKGSGSLFFTNNSSSLRGRKRYTGQSLYYPRVLMRTLAQVLTEEYSEHGVHIANIIVDGLIDSPGTRHHGAKHPDRLMDPAAIAEAYWFLHLQHPSCWAHEIQLTPHVQKPSV